MCRSARRAGHRSLRSRRLASPAGAGVDRFRKRPRVVDVAAAPVLESGPAVGSWGTSEAVVIMVHWADRPRVSRSVSESVRQFSERGYRVAVCSSAEGTGRLEWIHGLSPDVAVYRRPNLGYDFGSWASMLHAFPQLKKAPRVLLVNDSLVGPFASIVPILDRFEADDCDVWGLISTSQDAPHFQSHFVGYKGGVLSDGPLAGFWDDVRIEPTKRDLILRYEIGLWPLLQSASYRMATGFPWDLVVNLGQNPTSLGWRRLLQWGFPWVKREIVLRPPPEVPDGPQVRRVVLDMFGEDVLEWV